MSYVGHRYGANPFDHNGHPGWVAIYVDRDLMQALQKLRRGGETLHSVVDRLVRSQVSA